VEILRPASSLSQRVTDTKRARQAMPHAWPERRRRRVNEQRGSDQLLAYLISLSDTTQLGGWDAINDVAATRGHLSSSMMRAPLALLCLFLLCGAWANDVFITQGGRRGRNQLRLVPTRQTYFKHCGGQTGLAPTGIQIGPET